MALEVGTRIRFLADSRQGDWQKNQIGFITRVLATPPQNQNTLYVVKVYVTRGKVSSTLDERRVWATDKDLEPNEQLSIYDVLAIDASSSDS
jgi:hypothetical protein